MKDMKPKKDMKKIVRDGKVYYKRKKKDMILPSQYTIKRNKGAKDEDAYSVWWIERNKEVYSGSTRKICEDWITVLCAVCNAEVRMEVKEETTEEFFANAKKRAKQKGMDHDGIVIFAAEVDAD